VTPLDRLRLAAALTHSIAGAQLRIDADTGESLFVGAHPAADLDPCKLRRIVSSAAACRLADQLDRLTAMEFGGSLAELAGGVFAIDDAACTRRAVATFLTAEAVLELIAELQDVDTGDVDARIRPDSCVGVTLIEFSAPTDRGEVVAAVAQRVATMCFVAEVLRDARRDALAVGVDPDTAPDAAPILRRARPSDDA
jgi:hypothetical protein